MESGQNSHNSYLAYDDEIDLYQLCSDLCTDLWQKRALLMFIVLGVVACGVSYAYWAPEVYKAEARLLPPPVSSLSQLTAVSGLTKVANISPSKAFRLTNQYLKSTEVKKALLNSPAIAGYIGHAFPESTELEKMELLSEIMVVLLPDIKKKRNTTEVSIEWHDPAQAAELVNTWVELGMNGARSEFITNIQVSLNDKIDKASEKIETKKRLALSQLEMEWLKLVEAKKIADQVGLVDPADFATENLVTNKPFFANVMELRSLYLLGSTALSSEIETLGSRMERVEEYIPSLAALNEQRMRLEGVVLDEGLVSTAKKDARAVPPEKRLKPKRRMIMLVSLVLGVLIGIFVALIVVSVEKRKTAVV
jgi:chain length determinant protein (polysaccharide antigen chain regulator)